MRLLSRIPFVLVALSLLVGSSAFAEPSANARTTELIDAFKAVHSAPEGQKLSDAQKKENETTFAKLDGIFDLDAFVDGCLEPSKASFSPEQLTKFQTTFKSLLRMIAYPDSGAFLREAKTNVQNGKDGGPKVDVLVAMELEKEDIEMEVTFRWVLVDGAYRVQDVLFDGDSLVLEYRNQFKKIIDKKGVEELMKKLNDKFAEETARRGS